MDLLTLNVTYVFDKFIMVTEHLLIPLQYDRVGIFWVLIQVHVVNPQLSILCIKCARRFVNPLRGIN